MKVWRVFPNFSGHVFHIVAAEYQVDELQVRADEAVRLKDQLDEYGQIYRHETIRLITTDIAMQQTNFRKPKMSWKSTRRNSKKALIFREKLCKCANVPASFAHYGLDK